MGRMTDRRQTELNGRRGGWSFWLLLHYFCDLGAYSPWSADNPRLFSQLHQVSVCLYQPGIRAAPSLCECVCVCVPTLSVASIKPARADWDQGETDRQHQLTGTQ